MKEIKLTLGDAIEALLEGCAKDTRESKHLINQSFEDNCPDTPLTMEYIYDCTIKYLQASKEICMKMQKNGH